MTSGKRFAVIVAAGRGERMQAGTPKQFLPLNGLPVLAHTLLAFQTFDPSLEIVLVLAANQISSWKVLCKHYGLNFSCQLVEGGSQRYHSVKKGLEVLQGNSGVVGIHDGVRPLVDQNVLARCYDGVVSGAGTVPCIAPPESVRLLQGRGNHTLTRANVRLVQTPQCFDLNQMQEACRAAYRPEFTDDATVYESWGGRVKLVEGNRENVKITTPADLAFAASIMEI